MRTYSIKELENISGTKAHTIRIWEQRYNLLSPQRTQTGIRFYNNDDLKKILSTVVLIKAGLKISKIAQLSPDNMHLELAKINDSTIISDLKIELVISNLLEAGLAYDEAKINVEFEKFNAIFDTVTLFKQVIYPLLVRIGMMWGVDDINTLQEHFISNCIRQKLLHELNNLPIPNSNDDQIVLFLPENETHEIGLLFSNYLLRKANIKTIYLGQQVPVANLIPFIKEQKIKKAIGFISIFPGEDKLNRILNTLSKECSKTDFYWNSSVVNTVIIQKMKNHHILQNMEDIQEKIIDSLKG